MSGSACGGFGHETSTPVGLGFHRHSYVTVNSGVGYGYQYGESSFNRQPLDHPGQSTLDCQGLSCDTNGDKQTNYTLEIWVGPPDPPSYSFGTTGDFVHFTPRCLSPDPLVPHVERSLSPLPPLRPQLDCLDFLLDIL